MGLISYKSYVFNYNPQKDINYDFFFEKPGVIKKNYNLDKEYQVKEILFSKKNGKAGKGNLRKLFDNDEWNIHLRKIADWFLKRYDWLTTLRLLVYSKCNKFDILNLFFPRLIGAILIGVIPFFFNKDSWDRINSLSCTLSGIITGFLFLSSIFYLVYECYNVTKNQKVAFKRGFLLGSVVLLILSLLFIIILYIMKGDIFVKNTFFISSAVLFIGIFIQILWEDKTITEPL